MLLKTRAVVLDITPYAEASIIVKAYTESHGLQSFLVNGVRKQKARYANNLFQPLTIIEVVAYFKKQGGLHRVSEVSASPPLVHIPYDTVKTTVALFRAEILYRSIKEEEPNSGLFGFVDHAVQILDLHPETTTCFHLVFCLQLSRYLGFYPGGHYSSQSQYFDLKEGVFRESRPMHPYFIEHSLTKLFHELLTLSLEDMHDIKMNGGERKKLLQAIITYFELHHTQGFSIRSHEVLAELMG
ncbi:MAG: DNA repair protein RecO [Bacteroidetes bacterium]|nr:DNA repair protein RecO [Bacteroidota bacterium]